MEEQAKDQGGIASVTVAATAIKLKHCQERALAPIVAHCGTPVLPPRLPPMLSLSAYAGMGGMTPAEIAAQYRVYAGKCLIVAQRQENPAERLAMIDMAQAWLALAEQAEKNQALPIVYETPPALRDPAEPS